MTFLRFFSPIRAIRDLRFFLSHRKRYELWFMLLAMIVTMVIIVAFVKDSTIPQPYKRNIIYAESWPLTRTDAEIIAQQKIDQAKKEKALAEFQKRREKRQAEFKKIDDWLTQRGI